jgi:iron complex transport system ATP-binding protein
MLKAEHISLVKNGVKILDQVSCSFGAGELCLILGPNGAGKSSLVKILAGLLQPDSGTVYFGEKRSDTFSLGELARKRSVLSQSVEIAFDLSVSEVVMMGRSPHYHSRPSAEDHKITREAMAFFDITGLTERRYLTLSGGEKQRVQFARVLAQIAQQEDMGTRYLFLDEPLTFLDIHYQLDFMNKVKQLLKDENLVVIGVVHDLNLAARYADKLLLLNSGKVHAEGTVHEVLTASNIREVYRIEPRLHESSDGLHLLF